MNPDPQHLLASGTSANAGARKHVLLIGAIAFVFGIAIATLWFTGIDLHIQKDTEETSTTTTSGFTKNTIDDVLAVRDQPAGARVLVDSVSIPTPGVWVVIVEMRGDDLGNILGAARALGPVADLSVDLQRATVSGDSYAVVLYREDGDGEFNYQKDSVYIDWNSEKRVVALFNATP